MRSVLTIVGVCWVITTGLPSGAAAKTVCPVSAKQAQAILGTNKKVERWPQARDYLCVYSVRFATHKYGENYDPVVAVQDFPARQDRPTLAEEQAYLGANPAWQVVPQPQWGAGAFYAVTENDKGAVAERRHVLVFVGRYRLDIQIPARLHRSSKAAAAAAGRILASVGGT